MRPAVSAEMGASSEETRRHFDVVSESLRGEIRTVAEGVVALHTAIRGVHAVLASQRRRRR